MMDNVDYDPNKVAVMSAKLMCMPQLPERELVTPRALAKLAICCREYDEDLFDTIDGLTQHEDGYVAKEACVRMFSLLEKLPHIVEKVVNRLQESLHRLMCFDFFQMKELVSLDPCSKRT